MYWIQVFPTRDEYGDFMGSPRCIFSLFLLEAALCLLLEAFKFSPSDKEILWQFNGIAQPGIEDPSSITGTRLGLPLKISLAV